MALLAVRSKAVVLLLLIHCLMFFPLFVGILCLSLFCYALFCVLSSFAIISKRKRNLVALLLLSYRSMYCYYKCSVALVHSAVGWSAVYDQGRSQAEAMKPGLQYHMCLYVKNPCFVACKQQRYRPACASAQSDQPLCFCYLKCKVTIL